MEEGSELFCINCKGCLNRTDSNLTCDSFQVRYEVISGIPVLMKPHLGGYFKHYPWNWNLILRIETQI